MPISARVFELGSETINGNIYLQTEFDGSTHKIYIKYYKEGEDGEY